jgi:hypothetical protein
MASGLLMFYEVEMVVDEATLDEYFNLENIGNEIMAVLFRAAGVLELAHRLVREA